jgi:hypothetical protein
MELKNMMISYAILSTMLLLVAMSMLMRNYVRAWAAAVSREPA